MQVQLAIEWRGELAENDANAIVADLRSVPEVSARLETESGLGGIELGLNKLWIDVAVETVAVAIVETVAAVVKRLGRMGGPKDRKTLALRANWGASNIKLMLPADDEGKLHEQLSAVAKLISLS